MILRFHTSVVSGQFLYDLVILLECSLRTSQNTLLPSVYAEMLESVRH